MNKAVESTGKNGKKQAILRAAWKMMCRYGFAKTTVSEIAGEAGIGKGTVYLYFDSKESILIALVSETNRRILDKLKSIAKSGISPKTKIVKMFLARALEIYDVVQANPHGEEVISSNKPAIVKSLDWLFAGQKELYGNVIREGNRLGIFSEKSPDKAAETLSTFSELLTPPYYGLKSRSQVESFARNMLKHFISGISNDRQIESRKRRK